MLLHHCLPFVSQAYTPSVPREEETWKQFCARRLAELKNGCEVPSKWWAQRFTMKLISQEWREGGKAAPRAGEGTGKSVKQLVAQVSGGRNISKIQASKLKGKLTKLKTQLKATKKKLDRASKLRARYDKHVEAGEKKVGEITMLINSIQEKLVKKDGEDE